MTMRTMATVEHSGYVESRHAGIHGQRALELSISLTSLSSEEVAGLVGVASQGRHTPSSYLMSAPLSEGMPRVKCILGPKLGLGTRTGPRVNPDWSPASRGRKGICTPTIMTDILASIALSLVAALHFFWIGGLAQ